MKFTAILALSLLVVAVSADPVVPEPQTGSIFKKAFEIDQCLMEVRTLLFDALYVAGSLPEIFYNNSQVMMTVLEGMLKAPTKANAKCVDVANLIRYTSLEFLHRVGLYMNVTFEPLKDKVVDIKWTGTMEKIIENAEVFNAFYSCIYSNLQIAGSMYYMNKFGVFENMSTFNLVDYFNGVAIGLADNVEHCEVAADIVSSAFKRFITQN